MSTPLRGVVDELSRANSAREASRAAVAAAWQDKIFAAIDQRSLEPLAVTSRRALSELAGADSRLAHALSLLD